MDLQSLSNPAALFGGAAIFGIITACWAQIRGFISRIMGFMIVRAELDTDLVACMNYYAWANLKKTPIGFGSFGASSFFVQPVDRVQHVAFEKIGTKNMLFWKGWRPIVIGFTYSKDSPNHGTLTFIRGMFNVEKLVIDAVQAYNEVTRGSEEQTRFRVIRCQGSGAKGRGNGQGGGDGDGPSVHRGSSQDTVTPSVRYLEWSHTQLGMKTEGKNALNRMALSEQCEEATKEAMRWASSQKWYKERQIPWRRGWLLYGPPGTGKTSLVRSLAQDLDLPVYSFDLGTMSNAEFNSAWSNVRQNTPAIVLIEDIDGVFDRRSNILGENGGGLSFDCLLNAISGVDNADGVFSVITTNKLDCIDEALGRPIGDGMSTRPGRMDRILQLSAPDLEGRRKIARRILAGESDETIERLVEEGANDTGAQLQERCAHAALVAYWNSKAAAMLAGEDVDKAARG